MFKDEWIESLEKEKGRKPTPKEFIEAKNAGLFLIEDAKGSSDSIENSEQILNSPIIPMMADGIEHGEKVELTTSYLSNSNHSQKEQPLKKFCYKCGNQLQIDSDYCPKCGAKFGSTDGEHSFLTDITEKISDVSSLASKKTKELTSNVRTNIEVSLEKRKLDVLFKQLGEAYYSKFANDWDSEFQSLVSQIKEYEEKINQLDPSYKKSKGRV